MHPSSENQLTKPIDFSLTKKELREAVRSAEEVHALVDPLYFPGRHPADQWVPRVKVNKAWALELITKAPGPLGIARYDDNPKKFIIVPDDPRL